MMNMTRVGFELMMENLMDSSYPIFLTLVFIALRSVGVITWDWHYVCLPVLVDCVYLYCFVFYVVVYRIIKRC